MISCFPDPYPDELLYSLCARYAERVRFSDKKSIIQELFGDGAAIAVVDLPGSLGHLSDSLPYSNAYTVESLIQKHTLFPFFSPFLQLHQAQQVWRDIETGKGCAVHGRAGIIASTIQPPHWLRFCPLCARKDKNDFGEYYWHRLHQIPGVEVCPEHNVCLVNSKARVKNPKTRHSFIAADDAIRLPVSESFKLRSVYQDILSKISQDSLWLLNNVTSPIGPRTISKVYRQLLATQDLATYSGRVRISELQRRFESFYPVDLLQRLQSPINLDSQHNWLNRLVRSPKGSQHTLHHLLLINFLGSNVKSFLKDPQEFQPFGSSPWPCLNKAALHYSNAVIQDYNLTYSKENGKPIAVFLCDCGFIYSRTGPDKSEEDRFRLTKIKAFGFVWDSKLTELWQNSSFSLRGVARELGVDPATVKLHATRLNLSFPRQGNRLTQEGGRRLSGASQTCYQPMEGKREQYRTQWTDARQQLPDLGRTALRNQFLGTYHWLRRHDRQWLEENLPPKQQYVPPPPRVDWKQRDNFLARAVQDAAKRLYKRLGRPQQVSISAIAREIDARSLVHKHLDKLPKTSKNLEALAESRLAFAKRRILWVIEEHRRQNSILPKWKLIREAGIRHDIVSIPEIEQFIEGNLKLLEQSILDGKSYHIQ
ncbi:MAG: TnsD family transposase [Tildeniella torsiva UHER 1998/13D]|jgi:hypothetical protein|nr:TnsD family transposase [Tildeniella torsiva UHER 1998/13D]